MKVFGASALLIALLSVTEPVGAHSDWFGTLAADQPYTINVDNAANSQGKTVVTPYSSTNLPGVTRETVFQLCRKNKIPIRERPFTMYDLWAAGEVFLTGTAAEIAPVVESDGRVIGDGKPGPVTKKLMEAFRKLVTTTGTPIGP